MPALQEQEEAKLATAKKLAATFKNTYRTSANPTIHFASIPVPLLGHTFPLFGSPIISANFHYGYVVASQVVRRPGPQKIRVAFAEDRKPFAWSPGSGSKEAASPEPFLNEFERFCEVLFKGSTPKASLDVLVQPYTEADGLGVRDEFVLADALKFLVATGIAGLNLVGNPKHESLLFERMRRSGLNPMGLKTLLSARRGRLLLMDPKSLHCRSFDLSMMTYKPFLVWAKAKANLPSKTSRMNEHYAVCETAMRRIQTYFPKTRLFSELTVEDHREVSFALGPREQSHAMHLILESRCILEATQALDRGDFVGFGASLHSSHNSYNNHFRIFDEKADAIISFSRRVVGLLASIGLRYCYGEFVLVFAHPAKFFDYATSLSNEHKKRFGEVPYYTPTRMEDGLRRLSP